MAWRRRRPTCCCASIIWTARSSNQRLTPDAPAVTIPERPSALEVVRTYLVLGVEHILLGIDHLLFVLALLLLVNGVGRLVATVTAFTVAHSITLGAATLGFVHVPSAPVEAIIALSILFLASELARRAAATAPTTTAANLTTAVPVGRRVRVRSAARVRLRRRAERGRRAASKPCRSRSCSSTSASSSASYCSSPPCSVSPGSCGSRPCACRAIWPRAVAYGIGSVAAFWVVERTIAVF